MKVKFGPLYVLFMLSILLQLPSCKLYTELSPRTITKLPNYVAANQNPTSLSVFIDGTNNSPHLDSAQEGKNSNVWRMFRLLKRDGFYVEGVGTHKRILGLGLGMGTERRIRHAYLYLSTNYSKGDSIQLFGFSRGAYACRILSNFIEVAGIIDLSSIEKEKHKMKIIRKSYRKYRGKHSMLERREKVANYLKSWSDKKHSIVLQSYQADIQLMGLFESVEAFGMPDYKENFTDPNPRHSDRIDNVKRVFHAMALDDNRAKIYTPILMSTAEKQASTPLPLDSILEEVWFSGSHSDVGGSLDRNPQISHTSLNWMLAKVKPFQLFTDTSYAEDDSTNVSNMQRKGGGFNFWTKKKNRSIHEYWHATKYSYNQGRLKVHQSVINRFAKVGAPPFKKFRKHLDWPDILPFSKCFDKNEEYHPPRYTFKESCDCIEVVGNK